VTTENKNPVGRLVQGQVITADYLNQHAQAINANTRAVSAPRQRQRTLAGTGQDLGNSGTVDFEFTETSRTTSPRTLTDSNGETVVIDVIDSVSFENSAGFVMTLIFNNPA